MALLVSQSASSAPTQEEFLKSISENINEGSGGSGRTVLACMAGALALVLLLVVFNSRTKRQATPKPLNHPGKLLKEITKKIPLKATELRQLKLLAAAERDAGAQADNPLIFLLCPSTLTTAVRAARVKIDRRTLAGLARKLGLITVKK